MLVQNLIICFIDVSRAFDLMSRHILFYILIKAGQHGRVINTLHSLYNNACFRVKHASESIRQVVGLTKVVMQALLSSESICLLFDKKSNTRTLVTFGICFKQHFDTRYLVFYNTWSPRMFLSLDLLWEYWIQHGANGPLYVTSSYSTWIFCRGVSGFATDCPCGVWCRGLTTCLLHVGPPFGNRILNNSWAVGLT